ncbi:MAG: 30S ribosomal protein S4 [Candidatus Magasanikbacteria bacterium GW2011_GWC2_40_17]|uniref:Small ribosomal subunit protein uS4 n=1 Tax=Candidatus Magasanikbacteria bacterium GW2011_GWA2_42_32 TaxID=1619039 RepID=A0A0G1A8X0_9BACT|nr:MAG: 30S ribosomal protein S4 [Candidatus Magasanikbacteria bacterium GW2011_GWC2_40_17]KKS57470.1 MAG: 30S ribosomal protein S4 [Candidatus Magasanikbacteria bacterium GW2011_GWA2_42_32]OGH85187.1 MAG: 30S ribosomal protein S4 [Candidatus Magasanikbacteria bacterium RIFOXYB2_FULL_38_10]
MEKKIDNSICSQCRRAGEKLFLKGEKCFSPKCLIVKRNYAPGQHGNAKQPRRLTSYGTQLREKQKAKQIYGLREKQFSNYVAKATRKKGNTADTLLKVLETRLDNIVFRLGFVKSRPAARQLVSHKHVLVNGKTVNISSFQVKPNSVISVNLKFVEKSKSMENVFAVLSKKEVPAWLALDADLSTKKVSGKVLGLPKLTEMTLEFDPKKIIEFYSR